MPRAVTALRSGGPTAVRIASQDTTTPVERAWRIELTDQDHFVVTARWGMTIVDFFGNMQTCWHVGISAGDLARLKYQEAAT